MDKASTSVIVSKVDPDNEKESKHRLVHDHTYMDINIVNIVQHGLLWGEEKFRENKRKRSEISLQSKFRERHQVFQGGADLEFFRFGFTILFLKLLSLWIVISNMFRLFWFMFQIPLWANFLFLEL